MIVFERTMPCLYKDPIKEQTGGILFLDSLSAYWLQEGRYLQILNAAHNFSSATDSFTTINLGVWRYLALRNMKLLELNEDNNNHSMIS